MGEEEILHVVVVDDVVRFALHVWRYLGRSIGFGIGIVRADDGGYFYDRGKPVPLLTADGRAAVWWVSADGDWKNGLKGIQRKLEGKRALFLVDVKPREGSSAERSGGRSYAAEDVAKWLERRWPAESVRVVSSYAWGPSIRKIWPKSPETLRAMELELPRLTPSYRVGQADALDVLVTGAGFELRQEHGWTGSREPREVGFGLPRTGDVLWGMEWPFHEELKLKEALALGEFPWPCNRGFGGMYPARERVKVLAQERRLDEWWDMVFETELMHHLQGVRSTSDRRIFKSAARKFEVGMRNAFRNALLRHDWGHMRQSVQAVQLPWCAWLTTNYTRFADRAIALSDQSEPDTGDRHSWRVISTSNEALVLMRELQAGRRHSGESVVGEVAEEGGVDRLLFKLHGDISHLQTMAIAGHDKDLFSTLSLPVDSLHQVYSAAERYLLNTLEGNIRKKLVWHVVGHGLKDEVLMNVLVNVTRARGASRTSFRIVDPDPNPSAVRILKDALRRSFNGRKPEVKAISRTKAESYIAGLGIAGHSTVK